VPYDYDDDGRDDGHDPQVFANPGSALRAATPRNPRNLPCPTCKAPNRLTPADKRKGYQCDSCADKIERGWDY
jgi:hypothetical protein